MPLRKPHCGAEHGCCWSVDRSIAAPAAAEVDSGRDRGRNADGGFELLPEATVVIKTAAVADFRPKAPEGQKIKRKGEMTLELEPTADILAEVARRRLPNRCRIRRRDGERAGKRA